MNLNKDVSSWAVVKAEAVMAMSPAAIKNVLTMALQDIQRLGREKDTPDPDMVRFGASEGAAYAYPGADQQSLRAAFCDGAVYSLTGKLPSAPGAASNDQDLIELDEEGEPTNEWSDA